MLVPKRMMRNDGGKRFQDVTTSGGFGNVQKGHGIAFGDLNNDGGQDIYMSIGGAYEGDVYYNALYENPGHGNGFLKLKLVGLKSNRAAIGARIKVTPRKSICNSNPPSHPRCCTTAPRNATSLPFFVTASSKWPAITFTSRPTSKPPARSAPAAASRPSSASMRPPC